jgi:signal transduction histidine kinase
MSLEHKLPLLITALLVATMAAGTIVAYLEVQRSAVENVRTRLELLARDLSALLEPAIPQRMELMEEVASDPAVLAYLRDPSPDREESVKNQLGRLHLNNQADLRLFLMDMARVPVVAFSPDDMPADPRLPVDFIPSSGFGRFFRFGEGVYFWSSTPVVEGSDSLGLIAELRRVGGTGATNPFEALIGQDVQVYFGNTAGDRVWVTLDGEPLTPPIPPFTGAAAYGSPDGTDYFAYSEEIPGIPWQVIAQAPTGTALARPNSFLRHAALTGLLVTLCGMAGAWILSRRITQPIRSLRHASEAIARGDYGQRIHLDRSDEMGILADAYNHMAERVQTTHGELTQQYLTAQELADALDRASRAKSEFLATMSHEIRTPINAIIGYTDLLLLGVDGPVTDAQAAQLDRIRVSGRHLVSLVDQVLDLARVESGRLDVDVRTAPANSSVETMLTVVGPQAEEKDIRIVNECDQEQSLWYEGDPQRVDQILVNLLSNAIKFTDAGGCVAIRCARHSGPLPVDGRSGDWSCVTIEDSGVGIPPELFETIFEPFVQVESGYTRRHGGAGLGLSISLRLARSMGGDLTVRSEVGVGSRFTLWLPAAPTAEGNDDCAGFEQEIGRGAT